MKRKLLEYYQGNPDTISEFDDNCEFVRSFSYYDSNGTSFGYFQKSIDGKKEFVSMHNTSHFKLTQMLAKNFVGKAIACEYVDDESIKGIGFIINNQGAYKGRTFSDIKVITTWHKVSSKKLAEIVGLLGGVENFSDYTYVWDSEYYNDKVSDGGDINLVEYIKSNVNVTSDADERMMSMRVEGSYACPSWLTKIIRTYNAPSTVLGNKTSKLGNMTIAQYNSLIHQEGKKSKKSKHHMKESKYKEEFSNYLDIMNEALQKNDYKAYEYAKNMLDEAITEKRHKDNLKEEANTSNFGLLNHIFEAELPTLFKSNRKAVRDVIKTIKEDKNLLAQFNFYNVIKEQYNGDTAEKMSPDEFLDKLMGIVSESIDCNTIVESNRKLRKIMAENGIVPSEFVDDESKKLYENGHMLLTKKKSASNMVSLMESRDSICEYMESHKNDKAKKPKDIDEMIGDFERKLKNNLNESEISFIQQITDFKTPIAEKRKEKLFNKLKEDCMTVVNSMLKEDSENIELNGLKNQLGNMKFNEETIVKDIAKLLEIRDILMDD